MILYVGRPTYKDKYLNNLYRILAWDMSFGPRK